MQASNRLEAKYNLHIKQAPFSYRWTIRNPENGNIYSDVCINWDAAKAEAVAKIHALENAPTPTLPNGERI